MTGPERLSIFRESAHRRYLEARVERVLPRLATPELFRYMWIITALLMAAVAVIGWSELRAYISPPTIQRDGKAPRPEALSWRGGA